MNISYMKTGSSTITIHRHLKTLVNPSWFSKKTFTTKNTKVAKILMNLCEFFVFLAPFVVFLKKNLHHEDHEGREDSYKNLCETFVFLVPFVVFLKKPSPRRPPRSRRFLYKNLIKVKINPWGINLHLQHLSLYRAG